jgi:hypothetical protein
MKRKGGWQNFFFFILSPYYDRTATTPLKTIGNKKMKENIGGIKP